MGEVYGRGHRHQRVAVGERDAAEVEDDGVEAVVVRDQRPDQQDAERKVEGALDTLSAKRKQNGPEKRARPAGAGAIP